MREARTARLLFAALVVLTGVGAASAQTKTDTQIAGWNVEGYVEPGLRFLPEDPSRSQDGKFQEYRDINQGLYLEGLKLRFFRPDESYSFQISGKDWGLHTQEFHLLGERLGQWQAGFDWDQMRHIYTTTAQSFYTQFDNVLVLPKPRPPLQSWNNAPLWEGDGQISQQWYTGRVFFKLSPTANLDLSAEYTRLHKDGARPFGMAFGSPGGSFAEIIQPLDQTTHDFRLRGTWAKEKFQLQWGYTASVFVNEYDWVRADNPCNPAPSGVCTAVGNTAQFGTSSLPPNNQAHTFNIAGGINLPMRTRINSSFTYQIRLQNQDFEQQTYSNSLVLSNPSLVLPQKGLNGNVQTALFNFDASSRPLPVPVTFSLKYRLYNLMDVSDTPTFSAFIINDQNAISQGPEKAGRYDFLRQNASLDGRWQAVPSKLALTLGVGWEGWDRNQNWEVTHSDEASAKAAVDYTPNDWLLVRAAYVPSFRRGDAYNTNAFLKNNADDPPGFQGAQNFQMRKFNEADRNRQMVTLTTQVTPMERLSFSPSGSYKFDEYIASGMYQNGNTRNQVTLGLQEVVGWSAGMDVNWAPTDRFSFSTGYMHESNFQKQRASVRNPNNPSLDWISNSTDTNDTFFGSMKATILPQKLDFLFNGSYTYATSRVEQYSPNATGSAVYSAAGPNAVAYRWPAFEDAYARLEGALQYHFTKSLTGKLFYVYESFTKHDWQTDTSQPFLGPGVAGTPVFLGNDQKNYWAQIVGLTLKYKFE